MKFKIHTETVWPSRSFMSCFVILLAVQPANKWRSDGDISNIYASATPNPTGSLSGPWFDMEGSPNVTGVQNKITHLVCRIKNLGNQTVGNLIFEHKFRSTTYFVNKYLTDYKNVLRTHVKFPKNFAVTRIKNAVTFVTLMLTYCHSSIKLTN